MISSQSTFLKPFKRKRQPLIPYERLIKSLSGEAVPSKKPYKRIPRIIRKIGQDTCRIISDGNLIELAQTYENKIKKHGILLTGGNNVIGFLTFVQRQKYKQIISNSLK